MHTDEHLHGHNPPHPKFQSLLYQFSSSINGNGKLTDILRKIKTFLSIPGSAFPVLVKSSICGNFKTYLDWWHAAVYSLLYFHRKPICKFYNDKIFQIRNSLWVYWPKRTLFANINMFVGHFNFTCPICDFEMKHFASQSLNVFIRICHLLFDLNLCWYERVDNKNL